jgi:DNA primase
LNFAKDDIIKSGEIIVCEGYTDVIAFFTAGLPRAVATCGTALGEDHFKLMRNFATRIVLAYDADSAGQSAAASVYQWESQHEVDVFVAKLPKGTDPAELAQRDPAALKSPSRTRCRFCDFVSTVFSKAQTSKRPKVACARAKQRCRSWPSIPMIWCEIFTFRTWSGAWASTRTSCAPACARSRRNPRERSGARDRQRAAARAPPTFIDAPSGA